MKVSVVLFFIISCVVATRVDLSSTFCNDAVDINRFTQLLSNHLLFDHLDKAYLQLSRRISYQFRDAIQVKVKKVKTLKTIPTVKRSTIPPVDVQILKRQLKGAVGSFVEDKLPAILTSRYNTSDFVRQLNHLLYQYCPDETTSKQERMVSQQCLLDNRELFLSEIDRYTTQELETTLLRVNEFDLPRLFEKTRAQIAGILIHFNQDMMDKNHSKLELKIKKNNTIDWITPIMRQEFIDTVNHTDNEQEHSIRHFLEQSI